MTLSSLTLAQSKGRLFVDKYLLDKDFQHFVLSLVLLVGGGTMVTMHPDMKTEIFGAFGLMLGWWFSRSANGNGHGNGSTGGK
jgi:hypothetical protein